MTLLNAESKSMLDGELAKGGTVLVDYGAPWCPPCKGLLPILEELDRENGDRVRIIKVNCDELPDAAAEAGVMGLPTVVVYQDGQPVEKLIGLRPQPAYQGVIDKHTSQESVR